ncbi:MAG TPA: penicillin-binding protein 2 [Acidimicrobiales bacterium]|nr:penicillin-binding protein 2 [Acidimicrobiales bacterium]
MNPDNPRLRLGILGIVIVSLFAALFARLWYLQIMASQQFRTAATANRERVILEEAPRGRIFDRNGIVLVDNRVSVVVTVDKNKLPDAAKHATQRADILDRLGVELTRYTQQNITRDFLEKRLQDQRYSPYTPVPVADDLPKPGLLYFAEHHTDFGDAVAVTQTTVRSYPLGRTASHVLGYVGSVTQDELDARKSSPKTYSLGDEIGKTGVERTYEDQLRGTPGKRVLEVDAKGTTIRQLSYDRPVAGNDVYLSIDANVQAVTEQALRDELNNAHNRRNRDGSYNQSPAGAAVIEDPNNGQIIAMASFPDYDPSEFTRPIPTDTWTQLNDPASFYPLNNRALQGQYAPGSTFKLVTTVAGLRSGVITPDTTISDGGRYLVPGCTGALGQCSFTNSGGTAHGRVNLPRALSVSSDVYFYQLGGQFWTNRAALGDPIQAAAQDLGFNSETGIPLPGEQTGFVLTPDEKKKRHDQNPTAFPYGDWYTGDNVQLAIGQNEVAVTPLQLVNAYSTVANSGTLYSPNVAIKITKGGTQDVVQAIQPRVQHQVALPPEMRDPIMQGLTGAVNSPEGTAYGAFRGFPNWTVAGKTGTAQVTGKQDTALFVGIAPAEAPQYVGVAVLEQSGFGATAAAPVIRRVFQALADPAHAPTVQPGGSLSAPVPGAVDNSGGSPD